MDSGSGLSQEEQQQLFKRTAKQVQVVSKQVLV